LLVFGNQPLLHLVVCFFEFLTPFTLRGHNFLNSIPFLTIFCLLNVTIWRVQVCLNTKNNGALPLDLACFECISVIVVTQFATNEQLKDLTHMFFLRIPYYKLYKKGLFSYVFTLKYMCHFGMNLKKLHLKVNRKIKNKISWLFFNAFSLVLSYLLTFFTR
jgi:hypothetical protein